MAGEKDPEAHIELRELASNDANFIYVEDFYKLHIYIDHVTTIREDYARCGQAGPKAQLKDLIEIGRVSTGTNAVERAWPWQALITEYHENLLVALNRVRGGGSLISDRWVLTAAHVFDKYSEHEENW